MSEQQCDEVELRPLAVEDAKAFAVFLLQLDRQTEFMLYEPEERGEFDVKSARAKILAESEHGVLVGAFTSSLSLVGYVSGQGSLLRRVRHMLYIVVGILPAYAHHGIGAKLLRSVIDWGGAHGISRLELTVVHENTPAIGLYRRQGFQVEGIRRGSMCIDGVLHDELYMAKVVNPASTDMSPYY